MEASTAFFVPRPEVISFAGGMPAADALPAEQIREIASRYNVSLTDTQVNQLLTLCRSLEGLDAESLKARVEDVQNTLQKVSDAKNKVVGFVEGVKKVVDSVSGFFDKIKDIIARF